MVRRHAARSATKETLARARTCKTERFRRLFASKATKGRARILLLPQIGGLAELVYCTGLENQRAVKRPKGSNPLASSFLMRCSPAATRADCKSAAIRLRGFESRHLNDGSIVQLVECLSPKPKVGGSNPTPHSKRKAPVPKIRTGASNFIRNSEWQSAFSLLVSELCLLPVVLAALLLSLTNQQLYL